MHKTQHLVALPRQALEFIDGGETTYTSTLPSGEQSDSIAREDIDRSDLAAIRAGVLNHVGVTDTRELTDLEIGSPRVSASIGGQGAGLRCPLLEGNGRVGQRPAPTSDGLYLEMFK